MKIWGLLILAILSFSSIKGFSIFESSDPRDIKQQITSNDWNVYVLYYFNSQSSSHDRSFHQYLTNNVLNVYGEHVYFGEVDVSKRQSETLLDLVQFDTQRGAKTRGTAKAKDVPFFLVICHGVGWIIQGEDASKHLNDYLEIIINRAERSETVK